MRGGFVSARTAVRALMLVASAALVPSVMQAQTWSARLIGNTAVPPTESPATGNALVSLGDSTVLVRMTWGGLVSFPGRMCLFDQTPAQAADSDHRAFCLYDPIAPDPAQQGSYRYRVNLYDAQTFSKQFLARHNNSVPEAAAAFLDALKSGRAYVAILTQNFAPTIEIGGQLSGAEN